MKRANWRIVKYWPNSPRKTEPKKFSNALPIESTSVRVKLMVWTVSPPRRKSWRQEGLFGFRYEKCYGLVVRPLEIAYEFLTLQRPLSRLFRPENASGSPRSCRTLVNDFGEEKFAPFIKRFERVTPSTSPNSRMGPSNTAGQFAGRDRLDVIFAPGNEHVFGSIAVLFRKRTPVPKSVRLSLLRRIVGYVERPGNRTLVVKGECGSQRISVAKDLFNCLVSALSILPVCLVLNYEVGRPAFVVLENYDIGLVVGVLRGREPLSSFGSPDIPSQ